VSAFGEYLRKVGGGFLHWCPGCGEAHCITVERNSDFPGPVWTFNFSQKKPTFNPSVRIRGKQRVMKNGKCTGEWKRGPDGDPLDGCCHYFIRDGQILFQGDCTHELKGQTVALPAWPSDQGETT